MSADLVLQILCFSRCLKGGRFQAVRIILFGIQPPDAVSRGLADAIMDRIVSNAQWIDLKGESLRKKPNVDYNRTLKVIMSAKGYKVNLRSHKARYFSANVVMFDNGVPLKTIAATPGQKTIRSTEKYVKANKSNISRTMESVENKLYGDGGRLNALIQPRPPNLHV